VELRTNLLSGLALAVVAALVVILGDGLGLELGGTALIGVGVGAVLALAPRDGDLGTLGAFAGGFVVAWLGYALRAAVLPDTSLARGIVAFLVVLVIVGACALSDGLCPPWSGLLGVVALAAVYEETYTAAPSQFLSESPTAATSVLVAAAAGYVVALLVGRRERPPTRPTRPRDEPVQPETRLDDLMVSEKP
jgi:hypothetical protein